MCLFLVAKTNVCYNKGGGYMKVEKIKKTNSGKYRIEFDNHERFVTYDDVILKNHLLFQKEVDSKTLVELTKDTEYYDIYNKLIKMITTKLRSKKEVYEYLEKRMVDPKDQETIIQKLTDLGFINDRNFSAAYASDRLYLSNDGPNKIKGDLCRFGVEENIVEDVMSSLDEEEITNKLRKIITKKMNHNHKYSSYVLKQKLAVELVNLGYDRDMILSLYDELNTGIDKSSVLEKEYQKQFQKWSRKYEGKELYQKIKEKLYQKGFDINEINSYLAQKDI